MKKIKLGLMEIAEVMAAIVCFGSVALLLVGALILDFAYPTPSIFSVLNMGQLPLWLRWIVLIFALLACGPFVRDLWDELRRRKRNDGGG